MTITGTGFASGATRDLGLPATDVTVVSDSSIVATTPAHAAGAADVVVTNPDGQSGTLASGYTCVSPEETVDIIKATYRSSRNILVVEASSSLGPAASSVASFLVGTTELPAKSMTYDVQKGNWTVTFTGVSARPEQGQVCSITGQASNAPRRRRLEAARAHSPVVSPAPEPPASSEARYCLPAAQGHHLAAARMVGGQKADWIGLRLSEDI